jgi:hypothetical protein
MKLLAAVVLVVTGLSLGRLAAQAPPAVSASWRQTQEDDYTRYELLDPASRSFRIYYDVSATASGAPYYFNTLRRGSEHKVTAVYDLMTGRQLQWELVDGTRARAMGMQNATPEEEYLQVRLARPVPAGGQGRIRIDKTYRDTASYFPRGEHIVFSRSLGIKRNSVVLPAGYELISVNFPSQIATESHGRVRVSFMNAGPAAVPYEVVSRPLPVRASPATSASPAEPVVTPAPVAASSPQAAAPERAFQDREIVYFLEPPETHSFRLYHDYTETRPGTDRYLNVVRAGSKVSQPAAKILDTGQQLRVEALRGEEIKRRGIDIGGPVTAESEVAVVWFDPLAAGHSVRLRIEETYTDPARYLVRNGELVWNRTLGRPRNAMVLPAEWYLTTSSIPAMVTETQDGRIRLDFWNDRPDEIDVYLTAKRRP